MAEKFSTPKVTGATILSELVTIQAGYPFRGSIRVVPSGDVKVVQAKDISELGELRADSLITTDLTGKRNADWLQRGNLLFIGKGSKNVACCIDNELTNTTCAPSLFLLCIKPKWKNLVNPQFLTWQLNQTPTQNYFKRGSEGSYQINIRKAVLAETPIVLPEVAVQNTIAKLYAASIKENALLRQLIDNRQRQLSAIAADLIQHSSPMGQ